MNHYKETIRLGVPIMLGQLGIIVVNFADNIMVGHHSTQELAAASFVNNFFNLAFIFGMGFSYGLTPIIGRLFAQGNREEAGATLKSSLVINLAIGILLSLCMLFLLLNLDWLNQPKELYPYILPYYMLQLFSVIFAMLFNAFKQFSDGTTDTLTPMYIMLSANILNIIGNYFLIYGHGGFPELGLTGAGISTLFSRILTFVVFFFLFFKRQKYAAYLKGFRAASVSKERILNLARLGLPVGFQMGVETASFSLSVIMMGWLGSIALAAYQVAGVITTLGFMLYYGIGAAVSIRVSNFYGNHNFREIHQAVKAGFLIMLCSMSLFLAFLLLFRTQIGYLFTPESDVVHLVAIFCWPMMLYQFGDVLQILFANALRGLTDVHYMAKMALLCHFGLALPIGYLCGFILEWGALGVWCGFPISLTTLGLLLWRRFEVLMKEK
ncbi:MAG TPA: MATE family efflux transporter [Candidatus Parabacteroides intestinavium]|nr:MATE family efflux transporter [Candidatus Parabacteroides intestinavium]